MLLVACSRRRGNAALFSWACEILLALAESRSPSSNSSLPEPSKMLLPGLLAPPVVAGSSMDDLWLYGEADRELPFLPDHSTRETLFREK